MANAENIRKVIEMIKNEENHFDMREWYTGDIDLSYPPNVCGTPSCIGGWGEAIMRFEDKIDKYTYISSPQVSKWLGLSTSKGEELFFPSLNDFDSDNIEENPFLKATRQQAVAHLEYIIETGEVNWDKFV